MARIQELLDGRNEKLDYYSLLSRHSWIIEKNHKCILSPDNDGLLCGLLMTSVLDWSVVGFYDGKVLVVDGDTSIEDCIFLDIEIYRANIRSMGHHMLNLNKRIQALDSAQFSNCIQPNLLRNYDGKNNFRLKYPLATIHMLSGLVSNNFKFEVPETAIAPLLFTDGTFNVLFSYPENVLNWMEYLHITEVNHPLNRIFCGNKLNPYKLMLEMDNFFRKRDEISIAKERGDRLRISNADGSATNLVKINDGSVKINENAVERIERFLNLLAELTSWDYIRSKWSWKHFQMRLFTKRDFKKDSLTLTNKNFLSFLEKNPLSWAMTSSDNIEYTIEMPDKLN